MGTAKGLEKNLVINNEAVPPPTKPSNDQVLVEVISMSLNPVDYKIPELPLAGRCIIGKPASPGIDYSGRVVATGPKLTGLKAGQLVFGRLDMPTKFGTMGQYITAPKAGAVPMPSGLHPDHAAAIGTAGLTAYQCIVPNAKKGDKIFINGGSGGTGVFGIQIGKAIGCHVTTSCSTANVQMCKDLGADEVIDYKVSNVSQAMKAKGQEYSLVVDNVGEPLDLHKAADDYLKPTGKFAQVGAPMSFGTVFTMMSRMFRPSILGGGKRAFEFVGVKNKPEDFEQLAQWMVEGKVKAVLDSTYEYADAPEAYEKLKTGRAKGKIVVHVTEK